MPHTLLQDAYIFGAKYLFSIVIFLPAAYFFLQNRQRQKEMAVFAIIALPMTYLILKLAALAYFDPRPFVAGHFTPLIPHAADNGFPSDHTVISASAAALLYPYQKKLSAVAWILTVGVAISRVTVGVHHPIDVLASMVIAIVCFWLVYRFALPRIMHSQRYQTLWAK